MSLLASSWARCQGWVTPFPRRKTSGLSQWTPPWRLVIWSKDGLAWPGVRSLRLTRPQLCSRSGGLRCERDATGQVVAVFLTRPGSEVTDSRAAEGSKAGVLVPLPPPPRQPRPARPQGHSTRTPTWVRQAVSTETPVLPSYSCTPFLPTSPTRPDSH